MNDFETITPGMSEQEAEAVIERNQSALVYRVRNSGLRYAAEYADFLSLEFFSGNADPIGYMEFAIEQEEQEELSHLFKAIA